MKDRIEHAKKIAVSGGIFFLNPENEFLRCGLKIGRIEGE